MSSTSKLMDTEPGGEQTQYESIDTDVQPHAKLAGQLGANSQGTKDAPIYAASSSNNSSNTDDASADAPIPGMGEQTTGITGSANSAGGSGTEDPVKARREQGYGGEKDMDRRIGA